MITSDGKRVISAFLELEGVEALLQQLDPDLSQIEAFLLNSGNLETVLKVWNLEDGTLIRALQDPLRSQAEISPIQWLALKPDQTQLLSATESGTLQLWDLTTGEVIHRLQPEQGQLTGIGWIAEENIAIAISSQGMISLWDSQTGLGLRSHSVAREIEKVLIPVDGRQVICIEPNSANSQEKWIRVREVQTGRILKDLLEIPSQIVEIAVSPLGSLAAVAAWYPSTQVKLQLWNLNTHDLLQQFELDGIGITALTFTPDQQTLITATDQGRFQIWDLNTGLDTTTCLRGHTLPIDSLAVTADGKRLVSSSLDENGTFKLWNLGRISTAVAIAHLERVIAIAAVPDGKHGISAGRDHAVKFWDLATCTVRYTLDSQPLFVNLLAVTPDGQAGIAAAFTHINVWQIQTGMLLNQLDHPDLITTMVLTPDGKHLISAAEDNHLRVWQLDDGKLMQILENQVGGINALRVSANGQYLMAANTSPNQPETALKIWNLETGRLYKTIDIPDSPVRSWTMTSDSQTLIIGSLQDIYLWNLDSAQPHLTLRGHSQGITNLILTADQQQLISAGGDGIIKIWDLRSGDLQAELNDAPNPVLGMVLTPEGDEGDRLISHSIQSIKVWSLLSHTCFAMFTTDSAITTLELAANGEMIWVGDASGQLHFLEIATVG